MSTRERHDEVDQYFVRSCRAFSEKFSESIASDRNCAISAMHCLRRAISSKRRIVSTERLTRMILAVRAPFRSNVRPGASIEVTAPWQYRPALSSVACGIRRSGIWAQRVWRFVAGSSDCAILGENLSENNWLQIHMLLFVYDELLKDMCRAT
jgi:hypothetical protein